MNKRNLCRTATLLCGLLAFIIYAQPDAVAGHWSTNKLMGTALGLLGAIFATQWAEYQKRQAAALTRPGTPAWLRRLLGSVLLLTVLNANAQINWTVRYQTPGELLFDVAYGAGKYVTVGNEGLIQTSADGVTWTTQVAPSQTAGALSHIVYANGQFVVVGSYGRVSTSPDGLTWSDQVSGTNKSLGSIAYGGGRLIAVGDGGTAITSTDGLTWTTLTTGTSVDFNDVTYGGGQFVAVGNGGLIRTTPDGITWTARTSGTVEHLQGVTAGGNGSFAAIGDNSTVVTSANGVTWTLRTVAGTAVYATAVTYNTTSGQYVAVGSGNKLLVSANGTAWTVQPSGTGSSLSGIRWLNGQFFAVGAQATIRSSPDGVSWKALTIGSDITFRGSAYGNGRYVAVGSYLKDPDNQATSANVAITSGDGLHYVFGATETLSGGTGSFYDVAFGNGLFAAVGADANIQTSTDGNAWVSRYTNLFQSLYGVAYGGGRFVAVGPGGLVVRSTDGISWTQSFSGPPAARGLTYGNGLFIAVGPAGTISTSPDGTVWTVRTSGTTELLTSVAYGNGAYVAVGAKATVTRSVDGITWTSGSSDLISDLNHVTFGNGQFVTVGQAGSIGTSPDGLTWTARSGNTTGNALVGITHGNGLFLAVGVGGILDTSPDETAVSPVNQPPVAPAIPNETGTVGQFFQQNIPGFTDPDGSSSTINYSATGIPAGLIFTNSKDLDIEGIGLSGKITGTPTTAGVFPVTITAIDEGGAGTNAYYTITINPAGGVPPVNPGGFAITGVTMLSCQAVTPTKRLLSFTPQYAGLNGQAVSFQVVNELIPTTNAGPYSLNMYTDNPAVILKATQSGTAGEAIFAYNWLAACNGGNPPPGNLAPTVANGIPNQNATVGQAFSYGIPASTFADPNGDALTLSVAGLPAGLSFAGVTIGGTPTAAGVFPVTVTATDPGNLGVSALFTLTVNPVVPGNPASFAITGVTLVSCVVVSATQRLLSITPQYAGLNGQAVSFQVVNELIPTTNAGPYSLNMYTDNPAVTLKATQSGTAGEATFVYNWLAACGAGNTRIGAEPFRESILTVRVLGNPVENGQVSVEIRGGGGQSLQMTLTDLAGRPIDAHRVEQAEAVEQHRFEIGHQSAGLYLLRVSSPTQTQTMKVLKL